MSIASLVLGIIAIPTTFCLLGVLLGLLAVIFGHIGQSQYKQATGRKQQHGHRGPGLRVPVVRDPAAHGGLVT
jgi:predicted permease